nr:MAG TPA: hypothetical protein [Caudoviricetes sp.]
MHSERSERDRRGDRRVRPPCARPRDHAAQHDRRADV